MRNFLIVPLCLLCGCASNYTLEGEITKIEEWRYTSQAKVISQEEQLDNQYKYDFFYATVYEISGPPNEFGFRDKKLFVKRGLLHFKINDKVEVEYDSGPEVHMLGDSTGRRYCKAHKLNYKK